MVAGLLGDAVKGATVESGLGSAAPGSPAPYSAMGNMYFESMESFQNSFGPNAEAIMADAPNYTNAEPIEFGNLGPALAVRLKPPGSSLESLCGSFDETKSDLS